LYFEGTIVIETSGPVMGATQNVSMTIEINMRMGIIASDPSLCLCGEFLVLFAPLPDTTLASRLTRLCG